MAARGHLFAATTTSLGFAMIHALGFGGGIPNSISPLWPGLSAGESRGETRGASGAGMPAGAG